MEEMDPLPYCRHCGTRLVRQDRYGSWRQVFSGQSRCSGPSGFHMPEDTKPSPGELFRLEYDATGIIAFTAAGMNQDEQVARSAGSSVPGEEAESMRWMAEEYDPFGVANEGTFATGIWVVDEHEIGAAVVNGDAKAAHIARHDPARVLAGVALQRRMLTEHGPSDRLEYGTQHCFGCTDLWPCDTYRSAAALYADREGFKEEWKADE